MRKPARQLTHVLLLVAFLAPALFAQTQTVTVTKLDVGMYTISSGTGTQLVNVIPFEGGSYSFLSSDGSSRAVTLAPGMYSLTSSSGVSLGTTYIYSLGDGLYSFSNPTTGSTGTIRSMSNPQSIPLPALSIQSPQNNTASMYALAAIIVQQCNASGGVIYKPHWYSKMRCETPSQIKSEREIKESKSRQTKP